MSHRAPLLIGDHGLNWVDTFIYLGVELSIGSCLQVNCKKPVQKFMSSISSVLQCKCLGYEYVFAEILIKKCLPILMYGLDFMLLDAISYKIVTQAWNCAFRWLYGVGKYTSTRHIFEQHHTMSMKFLLDSSLMSFYARILGTDNCLLHKLILHNFKDVRYVFTRYNIFDYTNVQRIKGIIKLKFDEYCDE